MVVTYVNLSGTHEAPDKTIRFLLEDNWNGSNISGTLTPIFQSDTEEPDAMARDDKSSEYQILLSWITTEVIDEIEMEPLGDTIHHHQYIIRIDFFAPSATVARETINEINRILWENRPNSATRLGKSDGSDSEMDRFERTEITFERIEPEEEIDVRPSWQGELVMHFRKLKS